MYSAPACSITRKQRVDGLTGDTKTFFRMPTSPRGWVLSKPPQYNQTGGQLRLFWYVISGWARSNMIASNKILRQSAKLGHQFCQKPDIVIKKHEPASLVDLFFK